MKIFGLVGHPLEHSFSPRYFTEKIRMEKADACFQLFDIDHVEEISRLIENEDLCGFTVTLPYKQTIIPLLDALDVTAETIGAVNVVKIDRSNAVRTIGYNTDCIGFEQSIQKYIPLYGKNALLLGNGGAAQAVKYIFNKHQVNYRIVTRNTVLTAKEVEAADIIVNATPLGMFPHVDTCPAIEEQWFNKHHLLFDLVYNPQQTLFLKKGQQKGAKIVNGYEMLCLQADAAWKIWNE